MGGAAASRSEHLAAQGVLGGEGGVGEDASGAVCPSYTNAYTYILTRPLLLVLAVALGLMLGVMAAFMAEALRPKEPAPQVG